MTACVHSSRADGAGTSADSLPRRELLLLGAAVALGAPATDALAQVRGNIVALSGEVLRNGARLGPGDTIVTGDRLQTAPGADLVFVLGGDAFRLRESSVLTVERGSTLNAVGLLRLTTGALAAVWGRGERRSLVTPTVTAGIRGTGIYAEVDRVPEGPRTYFCTCFGTVDLDAGGDRLTSRADYHQGFWARSLPAPGTTGQRLMPTVPLNHTDDEMEMLARLVGQRTPWETAGRRGDRDGMGTLDPAPAGMVHPASRPRRGAGSGGE
ncbi:iron dicitrate transport regulator FecR [uncultured Xylophilus sp.]|uniref:iron dicitrate transport regulator FecR n=1 Tax=uncultured Xylophilus sp. TaxID=296832 RepID=UPI0025DE2811|nr:iron dicitrate transport regulator FecR [uncultured Xylophilus sp.]